MEAGERKRSPTFLPALLLLLCPVSATILLSLHPITMELIVYSATWCGDCREAKRFLEKHNIEFKEINIENTPGAAEEVIRRTGKRAIPQFVIDGEWVQPYRPGEGFLYEEMSKRLGVTQS